MSEDEVLSRLGLTDTGKTVEYPPRDGFMWGRSTSGRVLVVGRDVGTFARDDLANLSRDGGDVIAASAETVVLMYATVSGYADGACLWRVTHNEEGEDREPMPLQVSGDPPAEWAPILSRAQADQAASDADEGEFPVDHIFDAPQNLALILGGWRPEGMADDEPAWLEARRVNAPSRRVATGWPFRLMGPVVLILILMLGLWLTRP